MESMIKASEAKADQKARQNIKEAVDKASVLKDKPDVTGDLIGEIYGEHGIDAVYIEPTELNDWIQEQPNPEALASEMGITEDLQEGLAFGTKVKIDASKYGQYILSTDAFDQLDAYVSHDLNGMSPYDASEFIKTGLKESIDDHLIAVSEGPSSVATGIQELDPYAKAVGMDGMFQSANEAGMSPSQWTEYETQRRKSVDEAKANYEKAQLQKKVRANSHEIKTARDMIKEDVTKEVEAMPEYDLLKTASSAKMYIGDLAAALKPLGLKPKDLPKYKGKTVYTTSKKEAFSMDEIADYHEYTSVEEMVQDLATLPDINETITKLTEERLHEQFPEVFSERQKLFDAIDAVQNVDTLLPFEVELNHLKKMRGQKLLSAKAFREMVKDYMNSKQIKDISPHKFFWNVKRMGERAGIAWRKGDIQAALDAKYNQARSYRAAQYAHRTVMDVNRKLKWIHKFLKNKDNYLTSLEDMETVDVDPNLWKMGKDAPWKEMTLEEFNDKYDHYKEVAKKTREAKRIKHHEQKVELDLIMGFINDEIDKNLSGKPPGTVDEERKALRKTRRRLGNIITMGLAPDQILRNMDGGDLGVSYRYIKQGYDQAVSGGYLPRMADTMKKVAKIYETYSQKERGDFYKVKKWPGVNTAMSKSTFLTVLLNTGNEENFNTLVESGQFTVQELKAMIDQASKKDWEFVTGIWKLMDSFWPDVQSSEKRRKDKTVEKVKTWKIDTPHGQIDGGYFPIVYDKSQSHILGTENLEDYIRQGKYGTPTASQTLSGHKKARKERIKDQKVNLDLSVVTSHLHNVIYDLELGDAVVDAHKVIHDPGFRKSLTDAGFGHYWDALDLWLRDIAVGERFAGDNLQAMARWIRTGFTISKLGYDFGVGAIQPLGLIQAGVEVGNWRIAKAFGNHTKHAITQIWDKSDPIYAESNLMSHRADTFNKDIMIASKQIAHGRFKNGWESFKNYGFTWIKMTQLFTDRIVYLAAREKAIGKGMTPQDAVAYAERMVIKTQGSGIFGDRSAIERGSLGMNTQQSEWVRTFTVLSSYFIAKNNLMYDKYKQARRESNPTKRFAKTVALTWTAGMLYMAEAYVAAYLRNRLPDEEDDDQLSKTQYILMEGTKTALNGIPIIRDMANAAEGYSYGGAQGAFVGSVGRLLQQIGKEKEDVIDAQLALALLDVGGTAFHIPGASQVSKTLREIHQANQEARDISIHGLIFGPKPNY